MGGRVAIGDLAKGFAVFQRLIRALTRTAGVDWVMEDLQPGSPVATLRGEADNPATIERIVDEFARVGELLERRELPRTGRRIIQAADAVLDFARAVEYIRLETPDNDYTIQGNGHAAERRRLTKSIGAITGRVQTLSNRGALRFNLYDTVHDQAVGCYLSEGQEDTMREAWGRRARVSGTVSRERPGGRPVVIRNILAVEILEDVAPGSYRLARGALPLKAGDELPEIAIRRLRDA